GRGADRFWRRPRSWISHRQWHSSDKLIQFCGRPFSWRHPEWLLAGTSLFFSSARRYFGYTRFPARLFGKRNGQRSISQAELEFYSTRRKALCPNTAASGQCSAGRDERPSLRLCHFRLFHKEAIG